MEKKVGNYAFTIGVVISILLGLAAGSLSKSSLGMLTSILALLGLVAGYLNVTGKQTEEFLIVAGILVVVSYAGSASSNLGSIVYIGAYLKNIFGAMMAFIVPATVIVALKDIWHLAEHKDSKRPTK